MMEYICSVFLRQSSLKLLIFRITMSGTFSNTEVFNSPANAIGVSSRGPLVITGVTIDNCKSAN